MEKVFIGKIVNTFGIKGELKISSNFEMAEKAFKKDNVIIINNGNHLITGVRFHKNNYLVEIDNLKDINLVLEYKGYNVFIDKEFLNLNSEEYLLDDLLSFEVFDNETLVGKVTDTIYNETNPLIKVNDKFYIPTKANFIIKIDLTNKKIIGQNLKDLML